MPTLSNLQHEKFAQLVAKGKSATAAYAEVYNTEHDRDYSSRSASRLKKHAKVKARIEEIQHRMFAPAARAAQEIEESAEVQAMIAEGRVTIAQAHKYIRDVVFTAIGQVDENNPLCQSMEITFGENGSVRKKIKMPDKLKALEMFLRLEGAFKDTEDGKKGKVNMQELYLFISSQITYGPKEKKADGREVAPVKKFGNLELTLDGKDEL